MDLHVPKFEPFLGAQYLPAWITAGATTPSASRFHSTLHEAPSPFSKSLPNISTTPFIRHKTPAPPLPPQLHKSQPARPVENPYSPGRPPLRRSTAPAAPATPGRPNLSTFAERPAYLRSSTVPPVSLPEHPSLHRSNSHSRGRAPPLNQDPERLRSVRQLRAEISKIVQEESANIERQVQEAARRSVDERKRMRERERERVWERLGTTPPITTKKERQSSTSTPHIRPITPLVRPVTPRPAPHSRSSSKDIIMGPSPGSTPPGHDFIYEADPLKRKQGAKAWERWAEERVKVRRQEEDAWRREEEAWRAEASQVEEAIKEQTTRSRSGSFRLSVDHQTFLEQEQERRRVEDEQRRLEAERKMIAEQQRRVEEEKQRAEEEKRRIEEERRRAEKEQKLAEELRRLEEDNKRRAAERQKRQEEKLAREQYERKRQQSRERSRQRDSPERLREMFEEALREERHRMDQEWERLADNFIPPPTASRPRTPNRRAATPRPNDAERSREAWDTYERRWASLLSSTTLTVDSGPGVLAGTQNGLRFSDIPWPVLRQPRNGGDLSTHLTKALISTFVLSPYRLADSSTTDLSDPRRLKKSRLREAMLRWHPDKFAKILARVASEEDKTNIREGSEQVVRILNTLMASQATL